MICIYIQLLEIEINFKRNKKELERISNSFFIDFLKIRKYNKYEKYN